MAQKNLNVEIMTQEKVKFKGEVEYIRLPAWEGELGILPGHAPLIALLLPGECQIRYDNRDYFMALGEGFVKVKENDVLVLVRFAQDGEEIDTEEAQRIIDEEEKYFKTLVSEGSEFDLHKKRLLRAKACLKVAKERESAKSI